MNKYKIFSFTLEEKIVKELDKMGFNLSKLIRKLLKEKIEELKNV